MTLKNFLGLCTDPNNIEQIITLDINGEPEKLFGYWSERNHAEFEQTMKDWGITTDSEEREIYFREFTNFLVHFNCEVIEFDILDRTVKIESRIANAIEHGKW